MSGVKLQRTLDQWRNCDPKLIASAQSPAAIQFAIADAKRDISALATANQRLEREVARLREALRHKADHHCDINRAADGSCFQCGSIDAALRGNGGE
jgi:hypothetical protein